MQNFKLTAAELNMAEILWDKAPLKSAELVTLCQERFDWKKSTTYTILRRLEEKKVFANESGKVTALISKEDFFSAQSRMFVEESFGGSLPKFIAAFAGKSRLSKSEICELKRIIDEYDGN